MKIIDLLNKIANGEEVPKKIKYRKCIFEYEEKYKDYFTKDGIIPTTFDTNGIFRNIFLNYNNFLNDEVEILQEKEICHKCHKYPAEYNQTYCEFCLGISKLEEEKKIPGKLEEPRFNKGRYYIKDINGDDSEISGIERTFRLKINEIIDYLKSKGE